MRRFCCLVGVCGVLTACAVAEPVRVRQMEGTLHGFFAVKDAAGKVIGAGDLSQTMRGDRVVLHVVFNFKDGSVDDETTVFTQHRVLRLVSDKHVQRGPFFPHPLDSTIDMRSGQVTVRTTGKDGKEQVEQKHMDLPPDLANGLTGVIVRHLRPADAPVTVPMLAMTPKLRMVKLVYTQQGQDTMTIAGVAHKATRAEMKIDLGGVAGVVAPLIGKQPPDFTLWTYGTEAPVSVKEVGFLYPEGPVMTFEFAAPVWPASPDGKIVGGK